MKTSLKIISIGLSLTLCLFLAPLGLAAGAQGAEAPSGSSQTISFLGTVQSIEGTGFALKDSHNQTMQIQAAAGARVLRVEPGQKNLQAAVPFPLSTLTVGDRVLARGTSSENGDRISATLIVVIKKSDIAANQARQREEWEKGVGGLVKSVDVSTGTIILERAGKPPMTIETSPKTNLRRYAPGSIQFDQSKPAPLADIKAGDELRARGTHVAGSDGKRFAAVAIVSGTFRDIAGPLIEVDDAHRTLTIADLNGKHPVTVKIVPATELKRLTPTIAMRIAAEIRGPGAKAKSESSQPATSLNPREVLADAETVPLASFKKGEEVMLVATEATASVPVTAITVIGGVKPMLEASAGESQAMLSSAWNLNGSSGSAAAAGSSDDQPQQR